MKYVSCLLLLGLVLNGFPSYSQGPHHSSQHVVKNVGVSNPDIKISMEKVPDMLIPNKPVTIRFKLLEGNKAITLNQLKEVHTRKIHVLIIDSSLNDYHHIHPVDANGSGDFMFRFTPKKAGSYQMWVDITPAQTNTQVFLMTDLGVSSSQSVVKEETALHSVVGPYEFSLKLDGQPAVGQEIMASITVTKNGKPFTGLEPIMGAFAHLVGFSGDHASILHIHPMGKEPGLASDRGGPELTFHIEFKQTGFVKLFAQFRINGQDVYAPFGIWVN